MNTRTKIIKLEDLEPFLGAAPAILVIGTFDPLLAAHSERVARLAKGNSAKVVIAVTDQANTVLSLDARKEMVAALSMVDFVLPHALGLESARPWTAVHDDTALHNIWAADFKEHVRRRSQSA